MSCDVTQYLPPSDSPNAEVERIVHSRMRIIRDLQSTRMSHPRRRFRPKENFELQIETNEGNVVLLRAYRRKGGDLIADLYHQSVKMRALHTHEGHRNPEDRYSIPNGHIHFPTLAFPLVYGRSSYAYESDCSDSENLALFVELFCALLDIELGSFQLIIDSARN